MKKSTALLALFLLLALLAQGACAAEIQSSFWSADSPISISQSESVLLGNVRPNDSISNYEIHLSPIDTSRRSALNSSFNTFFNTEFSDAPASGYTRNALYIDISLWADFSGTPTEFGPEPVYGSGSHSLNPVIPLSSLMAVGTQFKNLRVFHAETETNPFSVSGWDYIESILHSDKPEFDNSGSNFSNIDNSPLVTCTGNHQLRLSVEYHFSPFVIVWDELTSTGTSDGSASPAGLSAPAADLPSTGDSSALFAWLLVLGGALAMVLLRRRASRA